MSDEYIKKDDAITEVAEFLMGEALLDLADASDDIEDWKEIAVAILENIPPADVVERAKCDSCEVRNDSYIEAVSATGYDHGFEDGYSKGRAERKHGKWIELGQNKDGTHNICCGVCGVGKFKSKGHARSCYTRQKFKYCLNCGADMKGEDDE